MKKLGYAITVLSLITGIIATLLVTFTDIGEAIELIQGEPLGPIGGAVIIIELITIALILGILFVLMLFYKKGFFVPLLFVIGFGWLGLQLQETGNFVQYFAFAVAFGSLLSFLGSFFGKKPQKQ
jgi:hypothetical protein